MSVLPGKYRCFDGGEYRVLFEVIWLHTASPQNQRLIGVYSDGGRNPALVASATQFSVAPMILSALWVGGDTDIGHGTIFVVYCTLDGVYARTEKEFAGSIHYEQCDVPRFERIAE